MYFKQTVLIVFLIPLIKSELKCPEYCPDNDESLYLEGEYNGMECKMENGQYLIPKSICNCFTNCEKRFNLYEGMCDNDANKCAPGLKCNEETGMCDLDKDSCFHYNHLGPPNFEHKLQWKPKCLTDGSYAPVQCKGEKPTGKCFCFDATGHRIFGEQWWRNADNMTCACSRNRAELVAQGRTDVTLHCDAEGNYEPLQCDFGLCWCSDKNGDILSTIVPEKLMEKLPCYNGTVVGSGYLRICESEAYALMKIKMELAVHGTTNILFPIPKCDADGSFGSYQFDPSRTYYCSWKDGSRIQGYQQDSNANGANLNCNCARDYWLSQIDSTTFSLTCLSNGDYMQLQQVNDDFFCVDSDGFAVSEIIHKKSNENIDCTNWIYLKATPSTDPPSLKAAEENTQVPDRINNNTV